MVLRDGYCEKCGEKYANTDFKWCKLCHLKENFINYTSGSEKIDNFIHNIQSKINDYDEIVFEWIPYDQFFDIKEIGRGGFAMVYSAIWKDSLLKYNSYSKEYTRKSYYKVALKCLHNSQNITNEFLNEV